MINWILALIFVSLLPSSSSVAIYQQCGGEGYKGSTQCDWPLGCFRRSRWFSSCQTQCPGGDWECATGGGNSNGGGLAKAWEQCGGEGWNGAQGCSEYPCQWRTKWYAQCRPDCPADWLCQGGVSGSTSTSVPPTVSSTAMTSSVPLPSSSSTDGSINVTSALITDDSSEAVLGRHIISQMLGSDAFTLETTAFETSETPDQYGLIVNLIITIAETEEPGLMAKFGAALQAEDFDERLEAWNNMRERVEKISEGAELAAAVLQNPLFTAQRQSAPFLRNRGASVRTVRINQDVCDGPTPDIGKVNGLYGDGQTGVWELVKDLLKANLQISPFNAAILSKVEFDIGDAPDPESRLGAFYATRNYGSDTVGRAVHRAIGAIYLIYGTAGEEKIGRVFNSEAAKALYNDSVTSSSSKCMAEIEHLYWTNVKNENENSFGGELGAFVTPRARDCIQRLLSGNRCSSGDRR